MSKLGTHGAGGGSAQTNSRTESAETGVEADVAPPYLGRTIAARYRIERRLAEGAMGVVVAARQLRLEELVAIKFLHAKLRRDPLAVQRLEREAQMQARIDSDKVARVLHVGVSQAVGPYFVMEYLSGTDLNSVLRSEGGLGPARAVGYVLEACEALIVAHDAGIIHRDIKPDNLFLARQGEREALKLLDFGISEEHRPGPLAAGTSHAGSLSQDAEALFVGTPAYMSPERIRDDPHVDQRCDIWSLGVVLYQLATGRALFDGQSPIEICTAVLQGAFGRLGADGSELSPALHAVVQRCLEPEPARRFQSVRDLAAALLPLATMSESLRGKLTGSFPRRSASAVGPRGVGPTLVSEARSPSPGALRGRISMRWPWRS